MKITKHNDGTVTIKNMSLEEFGMIGSGYSKEVNEMIDYQRRNIDDDETFKWSQRKIEKLFKKWDAVQAIEKEMLKKTLKANKR